MSCVDTCDWTTLRSIFFLFLLLLLTLLTVGLRDSVRYIGGFALFNVCFYGKMFPSVSCASAANVCYGADIFGAKIVFLNHVL